MTVTGQVCTISIAMLINHNVQRLCIFGLCGAIQMLLLLLLHVSITLSILDSVHTLKYAEGD